MLRYSSEVSIGKPPDAVYPWIVELDKFVPPAPGRVT